MKSTSTLWKNWVSTPMRTEFVQTLAEIARKDRNAILVTGDLGFGVLEEFARDFPTQYINAGVAEQNMTGLAVGLALEGKIVYTYSIGNFPSLRCLEQVRNDACYHNANIKIVCVGGGFAYGALGFSHHATEDLGIMRTMPHMTVVAPGDGAETKAAVWGIHHTQGPCYLRLGRGGEPAVHGSAMVFRIGRAIQICEGDDAILISTGGILGNVCEARNRLNKSGLSVGLYSMHTIKPIDREAIQKAATKTKLIVTVEEHSLMGGLGGAVAEVLAEMSQPRSRLRLLGIESPCHAVVGDQKYLRALNGLSVESIVRTVQSAVEEINSAQQSVGKIEEPCLLEVCRDDAIAGRF